VLIIGQVIIKLTCPIIIMKGVCKMRVIKYLDDHIEEIFLIVLLTGMSLVIGLQVFMRYVMKSSLSWSEEIARYMFIWMVYIGISYGIKRERHVKIDAAVKLFPKKIQKYIFVLSDLIFLVFAIIIIIQSKNVAMTIFELGQISPGTGISMGYVYIAIPIGFTLVGIRLIQNVISKFRKIKLEKGE